MNLRIPRSGQAAKIVKSYLASEGITVQHTQALELVARLHGYESWQAMKADKRFAHAPGLKPVSCDEYDFQYPRSESVWVGVENVSVYIKREHEGVVVDLFAKGHEDHGSLASTYLFYEEAAEHDEEETDADVEIDRWYLRYDLYGNAWYLTPVDFGPMGSRPTADAEKFASASQALAWLVARGESVQLEWQGNGTLLRGDERFEVLQDGGFYQKLDDLHQARKLARNLALSGAGGVWSVRTEGGDEVGAYLHRIVDSQSSEA